jgi:hypothetical protein
MKRSIRTFAVATVAALTLPFAASAAQASPVARPAAINWTCVGKVAAARPAGILTPAQRVATRVALSTCGVPQWYTLAKAAQVYKWLVSLTPAQRRCVGAVAAARPAGALSADQIAALKAGVAACGISIP